MKNSILVLITALSIQYCVAQTSSETVAKWEAGGKTVKKISLDNDTTGNYLFLFRNAKYTHIIDYQSVTIGDLGDLKIFVETVDSLINKVPVKKGQNINYQVSGVKNVTLTLFVGRPIIMIWDDSLLGYCYFDNADVKKMRAIYTKK